MKYLLDTHIWLWAFTSQMGKLGPATRAILESGDSELYLSAVTSWELSIKWALGRLEMAGRPDQLISQSLRENQLTPLAVSHEQAWLVGDLPPHHHDPFDRLLVAQAIREGLVLITCDQEIRAYPVSIHWALD